MSEPITLTERECAVFASMIEYVRRRCINFVNPEGVPPSGNAIARWMEDWLVACATKSASPPRAPGASAQSYEVGVESGPGQPIDICERLIDRAERLRRHDWSVSDTLTAQALDAAAAEIRRLRGIVDECQEAAGIPADQAEDYCTVSSLIADKVVELEDRARTERRAGIEDAVEAAAALRGSREPPNWNDAINEAMRAIRALAGKPPADTLLPGLEYIAKKIDEHRYAFRSEVSAAEAHKAAGIEYSTLVHREIAARKGG